MTHFSHNCETRPLAHPFSPLGPEGHSGHRGHKIPLNRLKQEKVIVSTIGCALPPTVPFWAQVPQNQGSKKGTEVFMQPCFPKSEISTASVECIKNEH